jgi:hypothetical protein
LEWTVVQYKSCCAVSYSTAKLKLMIDFSLADRIVQVSKPLFYDLSLVQHLHYSLTGRVTEVQMDQYFPHFTMLWRYFMKSSGLYSRPYISDFKLLPPFIHQFMYLFIFYSLVFLNKIRKKFYLEI